MALRKVTKIDYDELLDVRDQIRLVASQTLKQEQARGFPKVGYTTTVDNKVGKPVSQLKPLGRIQYQAPEQLGVIALAAMNMLLRLSPVGKGKWADRTGRYKDHHLIVVNNKIIESIPALRAAIDSGGIDSTQEIMIVNAQPYARKIERGAQGGHSKSGVYKRTVSAIRRQYGKIAFINQTYVTAAKIPGIKSYTVTRTKGARMGFKNRQVEQAYPAIRIKRGAGTI